MKRTLAALPVIALVLLAAAPASAGPTFPEVSVWEGRYVCGQGLTGLTLTIRPTGPDRVSAIFAFHADPANPGVPSGSYSMTGVLSASSEIVHLVPERWIQQPAGYVMVGMSGTFDVRGGVMRGRIDHPSCVDFELRRVR